MRKVYTGVDIGTYHVKVVIAAPAENPELPMQILGTGTSSSKGMRHGYIIDIKEATKSIREALHRAASAAKVRVRSAFLAVGGIGLDEVKGRGEAVIARADGGALEIVHNDKTGILITEMSKETLASAMKVIDKMKFSTETCHTSVTKFSSNNFKLNFLREIIKTMR